MGENKTTHLLEERTMGLRTAKTDVGGQKHAHPMDEETKGV